MGSVIIWFELLSFCFVHFNFGTKLSVNSKEKFAQFLFENNDQFVRYLLGKPFNEIFFTAHQLHYNLFRYEALSNGYLYYIK